MEYKERVVLRLARAMLRLTRNRQLADARLILPSVASRRLRDPYIQGTTKYVATY